MSRITAQSMRDLMNSMYEDAPQTPMNGQVPQTSADTPTVGQLPSADIAKMLSDVDNPAMFQSGVMKIENGESGSLSLEEKTQLANAFISLIKMQDTDKTKLIQKMMPVSQPTQKTPMNPKAGKPTQGGMLAPQTSSPQQLRS